MIIKPRRRGGFKQFSAYLQGEAGNGNDNEAVHFISSSTSVTDINAFCMFASDIAEPTRGGKNPLKNPIEHISIRTRKGDILTPDMIQSKLPRLLKALGYQHCSWILVQHIKDGEPHYHLGICRIDKNGTIPDPLARKICKEQADIYAREFGFQPAFAGANGNRFAQQKDRLARLWVESEPLSPRARLIKFQKAGFTAARGDRGQLIFVDRYGKPHSLHRIPALKAKGLKQADFPTAFGFDDRQMLALPIFRTARTAGKTTGSKKNQPFSNRQKTASHNEAARKNRNPGRTHNVRRTANKLIRSYGTVGRIYQNALSPLFSRSDLGDRGTTASLAVLAGLRRVSSSPQRDELRPLRGTGDRPRRLTRPLQPPAFMPRKPGGSMPEPMAFTSP